MLVGVSTENHNHKNIAPKECADEMAAHLEQVASKRCKKAFYKIFSFFAPRLRSYAIGQTGNEAIAMELVQDTMANVWQKAHLFNADRGSVSTWIFTIARNIRFDMLRKIQNRQEDICSDDVWSILCEQTPDTKSSNLETDITLEQIGEHIEKLSDKQRVIIQQIYVVGKSQQEVADELQIPLGTVKSRTRLALFKLRDIMNEEYQN